MPHLIVLHCLDQRETTIFQICLIGTFEATLWVFCTFLQLIFLHMLLVHAPLGQLNPLMVALQPGPHFGHVFTPDSHVNMNRTSLWALYPVLVVFNMSKWTNRVIGDFLAPSLYVVSPGMLRPSENTAISKVYSKC